MEIKGEVMYQGGAKVRQADKQIKFTIYCDNEEQREYIKPVFAGSAVTNPQIIGEIAAFCMVANEFCDQLSKCPLGDI